jgi:acyl-CoA reductase-like NAD-dependent aldehyde dehydrogenase
MKTYKLFINGEFPRSESGRTYELKSPKGKFIANPAMASRKDLRDAVTAARSAQSGWAKATAYNRGQILYRAAEMMELRKEELAQSLTLESSMTLIEARKNVEAGIDYWVWAAGWCDKIATALGSTNPVAGSYYNFTAPEALGVVASFPESKNGFLSLSAGVANIILTGNTAIIIAPENAPLTAITLAEILATSDLPKGVVNILTGLSAELEPWVGAHMEIDGVDASGLNAKSLAALKLAGAQNFKRIYNFKSSKDYLELERIKSFIEFKTVWHPIGY